MGLGKTGTLLAAFEELYRQNLTGPLLVVAPLRVADNVWDEEIEMWAFLKGLRVSKILGSAGARNRALVTKADIYTINVDNVAWLHTMLYAMEQQGRKIPFNWLAVDESSLFKNKTTKRFRAMRALLPIFERRTILTGEPAPEHLLELWPQIYILDQGASLGYNVDTYRDRYFDKDRDTGHYVPKEGAFERIAEAIGHLVLRIGDDALKDMPKVVANEVKFKLPAKARRLYDELERQLFVDIEDIRDEFKTTGRVRAVNMAVLSGKCQQLANGAVFDSDDSTVWHHVHDERLDVLDELLGEIEGNALIAYTFKHDLQRLLERYPGTPYIGGGMKKGEAKEIMDRWNARKFRRLFVHPRSAQFGLNIQFGGNDIVWFSNTFSNGQHGQLIKRLARPGQEKPFVTSHYLVARDTVDEAMRMVVTRRAVSQHAQLKAMEDYQRGRRL